MNNTIIGLVSLMLTFIPLTAGAQNSIKSAFDAILKCPEANITENSSLEKDPSTGKKIGQCVVYSFELPVSKENLIENVYSAFENDADKAYSCSRGNYKNVNKEINLAIGDGSKSLLLTYPHDCEFVTSMFLAPQSEDPDGIYRYVYAMAYKEEDGKFVGRLIITYAMTLKHRQQLEQKRQNEVIRNWSNGSNDNNGNAQKTWFDQIMSYLQVMSSSSQETRIALASKIYKVIRDTPKYSDVKDVDKETVREILKGMIEDVKYSDTVLNTLLNRCLVSIK